MQVVYQPHQWRISSKLSSPREPGQQTAATGLYTSIPNTLLPGNRYTLTRSNDIKCRTAPHFRVSPQLFSYNCLVRCETSSVSSLARSRTQPLATSPQYSHWRGGGATVRRAPSVHQSPSPRPNVATSSQCGEYDVIAMVCGQLCWHLCSVHQTNIPIPITLSLYSFAMRTRYSALFLRLIPQTGYLVRTQCRNMFNERSLITNFQKTWHQQNHWPHFVASSRHNCSGKVFSYAGR